MVMQHLQSHAEATVAATQGVLEDTQPPEPPATQGECLPTAGPYAIPWARELAAAQAIGIMRIEGWVQFTVSEEDPTTWWWHEGMDMCLYSHSMGRIVFQVVDCEIVHRHSEEFDRLISFVRIKLSGVLRLPRGSSVELRLNNIAEVRAGVTTVMATVYENAAVWRVWRGRSQGSG